MKRQMRLNAVDMNSLGCCHGLWTHPLDQTSTYKTLEYWTQQARVLERGKIDSLFIADVWGVYDVYGGNADAAIRRAVEFPVCDPFLVVPAMALVTEHLCFGVTGNVTYEPPFALARRVSTLDHLTKGRFAWNIVTGYLDSAARAFGKEVQASHEERYAMVEEYMDVVYQLWESWEPDAVVCDKTAGVFAHPEKVHKVRHKGKYFNVEAIHLCEPSPQRTPVLFQAGSSTSGRAFAARHAECAFISGITPQAVKNIVTSIRSQAAESGRDPSDVRIFTTISAVIGKTDAEAQAKFEEYTSYVNVEGVLALYAGYTDIDFAGVDLDAPMEHVESNAVQTFMESFTKSEPGRVWTLRQIAEFLGVGGISPVLVGSPQTVADGLERWMNESGVDGFNVCYSVGPVDMVDFVDLVIPELQARGVYQTEYAPGTYREKLFGQGRCHLPCGHPGAKIREQWATSPAQ